jgi:CO/xanthine dehydrogenase FAD-binding subunit
MIIEYHRPDTLKDALRLISRTRPRTLPLGGGTVLNQPGGETIAVVDLQNLGLNQMNRVGSKLSVGAMVTLQNLLDDASLPPGLRIPLQREATLNLRQSATIGGSVVAGDGRSPFLAALLALDAEIEICKLDQDPVKVKLGDWLPFRKMRQGELILAIQMPLKIKMSYQYVARTPADLPIIGAVVVQWTGGRTRLVLCGWGDMPHLAMDGSESVGIELAAQNAAQEAADQWASAEYRQAIAGILSRRAVDALEI